MSVDMEPQRGVGTAQAGAHQEVDEGLRALAPQPQPAKFFGIGSGLVAAGALAAGMFAATDPALAYTVAGGGAGVSTASLVVAERARQRAEIADHFTELAGRRWDLRLDAGLEKVERTDSGSVTYRT